MPHDWEKYWKNYQFYTQFIEWIVVVPAPKIKKEPSQCKCRNVITVYMHHLSLIPESLLK